MPAMASTLQLEPKQAKRQSTAPASTPGKRPGFFKRHLTTHRRRSSSVSFPNGQPPSPVLQTHTQAPGHRRTSTASEIHQDLEKVSLNGSTTNGHAHEPVASEDDEASEPANGSTYAGIRWASGYDEAQRIRPHRTSSGATGSTRRTSIFLRGEKGIYLDGADSGVGSKARRLSVHIPDEMEVDECPLQDHFSLFSRKGQKELGEGGAAVVRLMKSKTAGSNGDKLVAVKEFREWDSEEEDERDYIRKIKSEYAIAKSLKHPNIIETYRLCVSDHKWFHVMEYCDLGDLNDLIQKGHLSLEDQDCMLKQLLRGVAELHSRGIAHRDLKSENILLNHNGCLKIADFGTAEVFSGIHPGLRRCRRPSVVKDTEDIRLCDPGMVGSAPYMAPEIVARKEEYDPRAVDIWSCAILYISLRVGGTPWECASPDVKNYSIFCRSWEEWLERYPDGIIKRGRPLPLFSTSKQFQKLGGIETLTFVFGMLHPDPSKRWTADDILDFKTVAEFPCCQQEGYSDDIKTRQRKVLHNHAPPKTPNKKGFLKPHSH